MKKTLLLCLFLTGIQSLFAADYYWVGGTGSWTELTHWSTTSGGTPNHSIVPSSLDDVYFDAGSGLTGTSVISLPTAQHAYCRNMSWVGVTAAATFRNQGNFTLYISGNLELAASVLYGIQRIVFTGSTNATYKTNGAARINAAGWYNPFTVDKPGASLTVQDNLPLALQTSAIWLTAGHLNLSGNQHSFWELISNGNITKSLDISNAVITNTVGWDFRGTSKILTATNSTIATPYMFVDGGSYDKVDLTIAGSFAGGINNTSFDQLTFTATSSPEGTVRIGGSNTINKLEFKGGGCLRAGGNIINELIVAPGKGLLTFGNNTINQLLRINTPDCSGLAEVLGEDVVGATLTFGTGAVIDVRNVYMKNVVATGAVTLPITVVGADAGNNTGWDIINPLTGTTLYWVGGSGDWNDKSHWSATSGGAGGYCVPFSADDVVFDAASGFAPGDIVTTTANTWCKNMTWTGISSSVIFDESTVYDMEVWGSVVMSPNVTMNSLLNFMGTTASTLQSNGSSLGTFEMIIRKGAGGSFTLLDDLILPTAVIRHAGGGFIAAGRSLDIESFISTGGSRSFDFTNATVVVRNSWNNSGVGRTWVNNGSGLFITSHKYFTTSGLIYPKVHLYTDQNFVDIRNATIGELIFHNTSGISQARVNGGNNITSLEFKGAGTIDGINTIGTILMAPSKIYKMGGTTTINTLMRFNSPGCSGLGELRGLNGATGVLNFGASATKDLDNIYLLNITATGTGLPIAISGADAGGNAGFTITSDPGSDRFWVGGSGDWNESAHWSLTSGGPGGACIPTVNDNVYFNAASFTAGSSTITTTGNVYAKNVSWTGATNSPVFNESTSYDMEVWGDLIMNPAVTVNANIIFAGGANTSITVNGSTSGNVDFTLSKANGSTRLTLNDNISNSLTAIHPLRGYLDISNRNLNFAGINDDNATGPTTIDVSNTTFYGIWKYFQANKSLIATNSTIRGTQFFANGGVYNNVEVITGSSTGQSISNSTFSSLVFSAPGTAQSGVIGGGNTIGTLEFKAKGTINGTGNTIGTLIFAPTRQYIFGAGTNTTITNAWYGSGTPCGLTDISATPSATVTVNGAAVSLDYIRLKGITAAGTASPFSAHKHSFNDGGNTNWVIEPYAGSEPLQGLGPDLTITPAEFPYRLNTSGFFGSPLSTYLWNDGSTLPYLDITGPGTYSVTVNFADGCPSSDAINIMLGTMPVTLVNFTARILNCKPVLNWEVTDAVNFSGFVVERSNDGQKFDAMGTVSYVPGVGKYSYQDNSTGEGVYFYRLRLMDLDRTYSLSAILRMKNGCGGTIDIYPTVTKDIVQVFLPAASENAIVQLFNATGQRMNVPVNRSGNKRVVNLGQLPHGYYFLQVSNGIETRTEKIMKR